MECTGIVDFILSAGQLKITKRKGWVKAGIRNPESVADHAYFVALLSLIACKQGKIDAGKAMALALVHDLPEAIMGDIIVEGKNREMGRKKKEMLEKKAMAELSGKLGSRMKKSLLKLHEEYGKGKSAEARLVKDIDIIEMLAQALVYERVTGKSLNGFFS